jgi:SAM-dependent methyltransferase
MTVPEQNSVSRFDDRAADYVQYRPSYPASAVDHLLSGLGELDTLIAADIGAGTGISARLLGDRGVRVVAVEPGAAMRGAAAPHPNVRWVAGVAEATGLAPQSVDLALAAQAFHWFRPAEALTGAPPAPRQSRGPGHHALRDRSVPLAANVIGARQRRRVHGVLQRSGDPHSAFGIPHSAFGV